MTLDSSKDKQPEQTDATPDSKSDIEATAESATPSINTTEATTDAAAAETAVASSDEPAASEATATTNEVADAEAAGSEAADDEAETAAHAATVSSTPAAPKSSMPTKAVAAVLMLAFVAAAFIFIQRSTSKGQSYNLTKHDMEVIFQEIIPPPQQADIASSPEKKKQLVEEIRKLLSVASYAESEGYAQKPEVAGQITLQTDLALNDVYREKNPTVEVGDDDVNAYFQGHPNDFETFLQNNPRFQQQASGPNREAFKKEYGKLKVLAERARKDKLDQEDKTRLELLIKRSAVLQNAYLSDLDKNSDKLVSDDEINSYYNEHLNEFEEVRARHILISTQPQPPAPGAKPDEQPKALSKDEARKKAEEVLAKVRKGEDFAALAKQYSDDPGSKDKGGEYTFGRGQMDPDFEKAAFNLKPGEVSEPVETRFGYHIIKLEDTREAKFPAYEEVKAKIEQGLVQQKLAKYREELKSKAKTDYKFGG